MSVALASIRLLPPAVADAIAAGEVAERPASVVKELCENALDAGAERVDVEISGGGLTRILVVDDGAGIPADELRLAVSRHATSKVVTASDLERIATLGFRGEALASIAAVSDLRLTSRTTGESGGASIRVRCGVVAEEGPAAAPPGTAVEVSELFAATPARLRFLREVRTEAAHASRVVAELALTHPHVAFSCSVDGRSSVRTSGGTLQGALLEVLGARAGAELVEVASDGPVRVSGCISPPLQHRGTRAGIVLVVNGRRVHNRSLLAAMEEAYAGLLPQHRHPFGVVAVELDPTEVDVNVHPAKRDVRFRSDRAVYAAVQRACWSALRGQQVRAGALPAPDEWAVGTAVSAVPLSFEDGSDGFASNESTDGTGALVGALTAVGQVGGEWIVAEGDDGVVFVDPHAAHEKILYVELLERWSRADAGSQLLLMPAVVECDSAQMAQAHEHAAFLSGCGFDVEEFGPQTLRCSAVPATAVNADAAELLRDLLDSLGAAAAGPREERAAAVVACHAAVRFGDRLGAAEQQRLLDRLATTPGGRTCPHGRPTMLGLTESFLRRAFRRPDR